MCSLVILYHIVLDCFVLSYYVTSCGTGLLCFVILFHIIWHLIVILFHITWYWIGLPFIVLCCFTFHRLSFLTTVFLSQHTAFFVGVSTHTFYYTCMIHLFFAFIHTYTHIISCMHVAFYIGVNPYLHIHFIIHACCICFWRSYTHTHTLYHACMSHFILV